MESPSTSRNSRSHPTINANGTVVYLPRKLAYMYASRIEDRFGNALTYTYVNGDPVTLLGYAPLDQVLHLPEYAMDFEAEAQIWAEIAAELKVKPYPRTAAVAPERQAVPA